ncbi:hypothetical protein D3C87_1530090 [compost metagenome]
MLPARSGRNGWQCSQGIPGRATCEQRLICPNRLPMFEPTQIFSALLLTNKLLLPLHGTLNLSGALTRIGQDRVFPTFAQV